MKVHFAHPTFTYFREYETNTIGKVQAEFNATSCLEQYELAKNADDADLILLMESATYKWRNHTENLVKDPLLLRHSDKVLTYNFQDGAAGFLDGVYVHTEKSRFILGHHKSWSTLWPHNEEIYLVTDERIAARKPTKFATFRGSISHRFRQKLIDQYKGRYKEGFEVTRIDRWYDHVLGEKRSYIDEILDSKFVLCPRGICSYAPRFMEAMALGRVPVLLADDWVAPEGLDLEAVSVVVPQKDYKHLPEILRAKEHLIEELGANGRAYWKQHFQRDGRLRALIDLAVKQKTELGTLPTLDEYRERWSKRSFHWANGWTLPQRIFQKLRGR
jgi:hypothetical protein